ncbi:hypothetical protein ACFPVX_24135 [Cohnella faecalis]|uniref:Type II secretion system protein GspF domain-containing protein n=1 Tax=Cohnella faecalis TaxID=2315694 RepID=A0A398CHG0_9BACL|nr:hypothetical protein [Cohnella faecalis]RIE02646.1 hypothetical protein D3H35_18380 [Cohnella faecalis]
MTEYGSSLLSAMSWFIQLAFAFVGFAAVLKLGFVRRYRWQVSLKSWKKGGAPPWFLKLWRTDRDSPALRERQLLFARCGIRLSPAAYLATQRMAITLLPAAGLSVYSLGRIGWITPLASWNMMIGCSLLIAAAAFDRTALNGFQRYRTDRIRRELVIVGSQLLYYTGSRLHLHGKLMRCLPLTRTIRGETGLLLNEWYYDADAALRRFKDRLGTEEAYAFSECLRTLKTHESEEVYGLLRDIVKDYKAKIEMAKASRKETSSYLLFVLAGIPILYTFQLFLFPWVQEAAKLFDSLNP